MSGYSFSKCRSVKGLPCLIRATGKISIPSLHAYNSCVLHRYAYSFGNNLSPCLPTCVIFFPLSSFQNRVISEDALLHWALSLFLSVLAFFALLALLLATFSSPDAAVAAMLDGYWCHSPQPSSGFVTCPSCDAEWEYWSAILVPTPVLGGAPNGFLHAPSSMVLSVSCSLCNFALQF